MKCMVKIISGAVLLCVHGGPIYAASVIQCMSLTQCTQMIAKGCCCPTGSMGTEYICPTGWEYDSAEKLCTRIPDKLNMDTKGRYMPIYSSCNPTTNMYECYKVSANATADCFCTGVQQ